MIKFSPLVLLLLILAWHNPAEAQQRVSLSIETPCQVNHRPEHLAIEDSELFEVFPNPNQGDFEVKFDQKLLNERVEMSFIDSRGKEVWLNSLKVTETQYPVHLPGVASGLYVVTIKFGLLISREKLIIF